MTAARGVRRPRAAGRTIAAAPLLAATASDAHELLLRYDLPIPFGLYVWASVATLLVTFALFGWFVRKPRANAIAAGTRGDGVRLPVALATLIRGIALAALVVTVASGWGGTSDPDTNISGTLFWQIFLLAFTYFTAVAGDLFAFANPWRTIVDAVVPVDAHRPPPLAYPSRVGYWPAVAFYVALAWMDVFGQPHPRTLAAALVVYGVVTWAGARLFGTATWFRHAEVFAVLFRLVGLLSPFRWEKDDAGRVRVTVRRPFAGTIDEQPDHGSLVVFVLALLALTTYDGMHQTVLWMGLFWNHLLPTIAPSWASDLHGTQAGWEQLFAGYQRAGLVLSPLAYLAVYVVVLWLTKRITATQLTLHELVRAFAYSILPIAVVYNAAHYYTLMLTRAPALPWLFMHAFGRGSPSAGEPPILDMAQVWHVEVALIVIGHVVSVYVAHRIALRCFPSTRDAVASQVPLLVLMVGYTVVGLWVISLPFALT